MNARRALIIVFWLAMTGWLVRYEAFPEWFAASGRAYPALLRDAPLVVDSWMQVLFKETPIGYSHTWVDSRVESPDESYTVNNTTLLTLKLMGLDHWVKISVGATLDAAYRLQSFSAVMHSAVYVTRLEGRRTGPGRFSARAVTGGAERLFSLEIPDDAIVYSPMTEMAMRRLQPGQVFAFKAFDPLSMTTSDIRVQALRRELFHLDGRDHEATVLKMFYQGLETLSWINREGMILRQETPFGWTLQACSPEQALAPRRDGLPAEDLLAALAVPCRGVGIARPRESRKIRLVLRGGGLDPAGVASHRQLVEARGTNSLELTLLSQPAPIHPRPLGPAPEELRPYLVSSAFIQADHPDMIQQARAIVGDRTDSWEAAVAIHDWVFRHVAKQSAISLPSALDVLRKLEGDCNEHTYLFTALARAAGLPARIHVGLVYAELPGKPEGAFYYHAWPSVHVGEWVELDPTFGQPLVDATHLSLITGELADQIKLLGLIGQASADILEAE